MASNTTRNSAELDASIQESLFKTIFAIKHQVKEEFRSSELDLNPMHVRVIKILSKHEPLSQQAIADFLQRDKAQVNRLTSELVEKGLIVKVASTSDRRATELSLSQQGRQVVVQLRDIERQTNRQMLKGIPREDRQLLQELLTRISDNLAVGD